MVLKANSKMVEPQRTWTITEKSPGLWLIQFEAMRSPCEVWLETDQASAESALIWAAKEAWRIEKKYSRFDPNSVLSQINQKAGDWQTVDEETASLLEFADQCWQLTDGLIDVTIGGFLSLWRFDGHTPPPTRNQLKKQAHYVGWQKVNLDGDQLLLPEGVRLDFGGIGKEYAVDSIALELENRFPGTGVMVNFGGDLMASGGKQDGSVWTVGIENPNNAQHPIEVIELRKGAVATSGDVKRFAVDKHGKVLGHILNPKTGWPVAKGPATVTVMGQTASQCGLLATLAMLKGKHADEFLKSQGIRYWLQDHSG